MTAWKYPIYSSKPDDPSMWEELGNWEHNQPITPYKEPITMAPKEFSLSTQSTFDEEYLHEEDSYSSSVTGLDHKASPHCMCKLKGWIL